MTTSSRSDVVAITGGIGSGKTTVCQMLAELGAAVVDADEAARQVVAPGSVGLDQIRRAFGPAVLKPDGSLNRAALGKLVFADRSKRELLEAITHPLIRKFADEELERQRASCPPLIVYDVPLLFESGLDALGFRKIVVVTAPEIDCIARVVARSGLNSDEVRKRIAAQMPLAEKARRADYVLENTGTEADLRRSVINLFDELKLG